MGGLKEPPCLENDQFQQAIVWLVSRRILEFSQPLVTWLLKVNASQTEHEFESFVLC